jgi:hypothetical protein
MHEASERYRLKAQACERFSREASDQATRLLGQRSLSNGTRSRIEWHRKPDSVQIIENRKDISAAILRRGPSAFPSVGERAMCEKCDENRKDNSELPADRADHHGSSHDWPCQKVSCGLARNSPKVIAPSDRRLRHPSTVMSHPRRNAMVRSSACMAQL